MIGAAVQNPDIVQDFFNFVEKVGRFFSPFTLIITWM
jgi:hypothetical protein